MTEEVATLGVVEVSKLVGATNVWKWASPRPGGADRSCRIHEPSAADERLGASPSYNQAGCGCLSVFARPIP